MGDPITTTLAGGGILSFKAKEIDEAKAARRDQKRAAEIQAAKDQNERTAAIRQQARQERIRRASLMAAAESSGVGGSSIETGGIGSGQILAASGQAFATGQSMANQAQSNYLQKAATHQGKSAEFGAYFDLAMQGITMGVGGS